MAGAAFVSIDAPASASPGQVVSIPIILTNTYHLRALIAPAGQFNSSPVSIAPHSVWLSQNEQAHFVATFTMPSQNVKLALTACSSYDGATWDIDETKEFSIKAVVVEPEVSGLEASFASF